MLKLRPAWTALIAGFVFGILFALLIKFGNPPNMGVCVLCFYRDIAGALGLHKIETLAYLRPEIMGFIVGALLAALMAKEFQPRGGSSPLLRFTISAFVAFGGMVFLGCPTRLMGRLAGGDPTALVGLAGLLVGIGIGIRFLRAGFALGTSVPVHRVSGWVIPVSALLLLIFLLLRPAFITLSPKGHAPLLISLVAGLVVGVLGQRSRFCFVGSIKNALMMADFRLLQGLIAFLLFCFLTNLVLGQFHPGAHPVAHTDHVANFLGMLIVGLGSMLVGGCPFRQTILAGQGSSDAGLSVLGMVAGGALAHNVQAAASPAGVAAHSYSVLIIGLLFLITAGYLSRNN